jgi:hypothetical protein
MIEKRSGRMGVLCLNNDVDIIYGTSVAIEPVYHLARLEKKLIPFPILYLQFI